MASWFPSIPLWVICGLAGFLTGVLSAWGTWKSLRDCELVPGRGPFWYGLLGVLLGAGLVWTAHHGWQSTVEVIPSDFWRPWRTVYHLSLIVLLVMITATDLRSYFILEWTCWVGIAIALTGAVISGDFQIAHVWVDWNQEVPQLRGPGIPDWLSAHPHLHGLAWSMAGLVCGVVLMGLTRVISSIVLGMTTLGSGDVYLMAFIGAYLGWQPTVVVVLLAPILALGIGLTMRLLGSQAPLPYGPFLALGAVITLFCWRWIWMAEFSLAAGAAHDRASTFAVRRLFGDPVTLLIVAALAGGLLLLLLGLLRIYKSVPLGKTEKPGPAA